MPIYNDDNKAQENYWNYRFCYENGHDEWIKLAGRCFDFYRNRQWSEGDLQFLAAAGRPALTFNIVETMVRAAKGIQRAMRNDVRFMPVEDAGAEEAQVMDKLWMHTQADNSFDFVESEVWERGLIMNRAYYDVRMKLDEQARAHVSIKPLRSQDVILDPAIDSYDPADWPQVFVVRWVSRQDIEYMYGKDKADALGYSEMPSWYMYEDRLMAATLGKQPYYHWQGVPDEEKIRAYRLIDRQYRELKLKKVFIDTRTGDTSEIPENWDRERIGKLLESVPGVAVTKKKVLTIRWRTSCEHIMLHDEDSPYSHLTTVPFFPTFVDGQTMGLVEHMLDPQQLYNKVTSQELAIINTTANSGYKMKAGSLVGMTKEELRTVGAQPGFVVEVKNMDDLEKFTPNQVPQGHDRISFKADKILRDIAGVPNSSRGYAREDVAGEAIELNQAANDINWASYLGNLHRSKQIVAKYALDIYQTFYTEERLIQITKGSVYNPQVESVTINGRSPEGQYINDITQGRFTTVLVPAPSRSSMQEGEFQQMIELRKLGIQIPDTVMVELSGAPNKQQILEQLQGDSAEAQQQQQQMEMELHSLQVQLLQAQIEETRSRGQETQAKAQKTLLETHAHPEGDDALEVERVRGQTQKEIAALQGKIDVLKETMKSRAQEQSGKIKLADIASRERIADKNNAAKVAVAKAKPKPKPTAKKSTATKRSKK